MTEARSGGRPSREAARMGSRIASAEDWYSQVLLRKELSFKNGGLLREVDAFKPVSAELAEAASRG